MAKNEAKIKFTAETGKFNDAIKKSNDVLSKLRAETKLNETQMKATGNSVEGLQQKQKLLGDQLKVSQEKTEALNQKLDKAVEIFGENSTEVTKLQRQLANAKNEEEKLKIAIEQCNTELQQFENEAKQAESATDQLTDKIDKQQTELTKLKGDYVEAVLKFGDVSDEAKKLAREIEDLSGELKDSKSAFEDASDKADKLDKSLDDAGDSASNSTGGFTTVKGAIAELAANAIQMAIDKIKEFIGYLLELPEATRELRQDMATLDTSFERAGFTAEQATNTWKDLYTIFGEDDRAVEAANLIAKMSKNQEDLNSWITITQGVWGTYQDSLPVEGLAEASNETAKTGQVTGVLADALNWSSEAATMFSKYMSEDVTTAEDAFNEALKECTTEEERQALITETLTKLYGDAAAKYEEASGSQLEAKEATAENTLVQNELADAIEPVTTQWEQLKTKGLEAVLPAIQTICEFIAENDRLLKFLAVTLAIITGAIALLIAGFVGMIAVLNIGVVAIVAAVALIITYWDKLVEWVKTGWEWIKATLSTVGEWINTNVIQPVLNFFKNLWDGIKQVWDGICNAVSFAFQLIGSIISAAFQIITLPFRFIWENCKEAVFTAFEWIKSKIQIAINFIKNIVQIGFNFVKEKIINPIIEAKNKAVETFNNLRNSAQEKINALKEKVTSTFNTIKEKIMTPINAAKNKAIEIFNSLRSSVQEKINSIKSTVTTVFNNIKSAITKPIEDAKTKVKSVVDAIKGFFSNMKLNLPHIKLPHFSVSGKLSIDPPSVPKLKIDWYAKGGIMTKPTIFGMNGSRLMGGGEAGYEAVLPIEKLKTYMSEVVEDRMNVVNLQAVADAIENLANRPNIFRIGDRDVALATASAGDSVNGFRTSLKLRGLEIE